MLEEGSQHRNQTQHSHEVAYNIYVCIHTEFFFSLKPLALPLAKTNGDVAVAEILSNPENIFSLVKKLKENKTSFGTDWFLQLGTRQTFL